MADLDTVFVEAGLIGIPDGLKEGGRRVDFRDGDFDFLIETKTPRFGWARAALCPCVGWNEQADLPNPDCDVCSGIGWLHFKPTDACVDEEKLGALSSEQRALLTRYNATPIRALMTGSSKEANLFDALGKWALGSALVTVRSQNRLGYYDKLISLDEEMIFSETVKLTAAQVSASRVKTRYAVAGLNLVRSLTTVYTDKDLYLESGDVVWKSGKMPAAGTRLTLHYVCRPVWVVLEHAKLNRTSVAKFKKPKTELQTPVGDTQKLPVQSLVRLEHLPFDL